MVGAQLEPIGLAEALLEASGIGGETPLFVAAISLAAMSLVADGNGEIDDRVRDDAVRALSALQADGVGPEFVLPAHMLLLPAAITLALLAPGADQTALLAVLSNAPSDGAMAQQLPSLRDMARIMAQSPVAGTALVSAPDVMAALVSEEAWQQELNRAQAEISDWHQAQLARSIRYAAATNVWREMLRPGGPFGAPIQVAMQGTISRAGEVRSFLAKVDVEESIREVERQVRGVAAARRSPIEGPAYREMQGAAQEAVLRLRGWLALVKRAPSQGDTSRRGPIAELRNQLRMQIDAAQADLARVHGSAASTAPVALAILARLREVLEGKAPQRAAATIDELLGRDLLPATGVRLARDWTRVRPLPAALSNELETIAAGDPPSPSDCARLRIAIANYVGAELAIGLMSEADGAPRLQRELRHTVEARKADELALLERTRSEVEEAERTGRLDTGQAQELSERLRRVRPEIEAAEPVIAEIWFQEAKSEIGRAHETLHKRADAVRARIQSKLGTLRGLSLADRDRNRRSAGIRAVRTGRRFGRAAGSRRAAGNRPPDCGGASVRRLFPCPR